MILAYDFEVFRYNWMVVIADLVAEKEEVIIDDSAKLKSFYPGKLPDHLNHHSIYNHCPCRPAIRH